MSDNQADMGLSVLLATAREVSPELPEDLVRRAYAIQRAHQFDHDRTVSHQQMLRLIEEYANAAIDADAPPGSSE